MYNCGICGQEDKDIKHLPLYVNGSEGVQVCVACRVSLTEVARSMIRVFSIGKKTGWKFANEKYIEITKNKS